MSIREHGQRFQVKVYAGKTPQGRERYVYGSAPTKRAAESLERHLATQVENGRHRHGSHTFGELLDKWYETASPDLQVNTRKGYEGWTRRVIRPELGDVQLAKLTPDVLDELYARLRVVYSARSIRQVHAIISRACAVGIRWGWLSANPASATSPPKVGRTQTQPPEPDEARRFLAALATEDPDLAMFLRLAAITGARRSELCGLRWGDFDLDGGSVVLERALVGLPDGETAEKVLKRGNAHRLALDAVTLQALTVFHAAALTRGEKLGDWDPNQYVFLMSPGRPWHPDNHATGRYRRATRRHGMTARLHDWRHYAATQMLDAGIPVKTVADRLGHASAQVTLGVYAHAVPATDSAAADALARTLDG